MADSTGSPAIPNIAGNSSDQVNKENENGNPASNIIAEAEGGEVANATKLRLIPAAGGSAADKPPMPPTKTGPAKGSEVPVSDHIKDSSGDKQVAQQFENSF